MPSLTLDEPIRHLLVLMAILLCLIGIAILQTLKNPAPPPRPKKRKKKVARQRKKVARQHKKKVASQHKKKPSKTKTLQTTDQKVSHLTGLPVELLMLIFQHLAPDEVQPYLDDTSFQAYTQAQKDLRNVCLVSKKLGQVGCPYLYQRIVVKDADNMAYFLRTLDDNRSLAQKVKQLVLEVPSSLKDEQYRKPNAAILGSRPSLKAIREISDRASNFDSYQSALVQIAEVRRNRTPPETSFEEWTWEMCCEVFDQMRFEILLRTENLERLSFGMILPRKHFCSSGYEPFMDDVQSTLGFGTHFRRRVWDFKPVVPFLSRLTRLQLLGDIGEGQKPFAAELVECFLGIVSLRTIECFHDDGMWERVDPHGTRSKETTGVAWQCENITRIDLQRSHCEPRHILTICTMFPALERLGIAIDSVVLRWTHERVILSDALAKLTHLRELVLDLHYYRYVRLSLGLYGVINLAGLSKLLTLRLPLHFLVEMQPGVEPFVPDMAQVLPPSLNHLTVWANMDRVTHSEVTAFADPLTTFTNDRIFHPRQSAINFLEAIFSRVPDHFRHLEEVTYCYGDKELLAACCCDGDTTCNRCEASEFLDPHAVDDSSARMQILTSDFETRGIRLRVMEAQV